MSSGLRILTFGRLVLALVARDARAAEGGYSNYIPGTYGNFAVAVAPDLGLTLRNNIYYYDADESLAVLQGQVRVDLDLASRDKTQAKLNAAARVLMAHPGQASALPIADRHPSSTSSPMA